jgi:hypothetical protein
LNGVDIDLKQMTNLLRRYDGEPHNEIVV